jgi:hypothetical protein
MQLVVQVIAWAIAVPLELLVISALLKGHYRRYPLFFLYCIGYFLTTAIDISVNAAYFARIPGAKGHRVFWYWVNEGIMQTLVFALVISLIYHATKNIGPRRMVRIVLVAGAFLFAGISFLVHYSTDLVLSAWMTPWSRDLNFSSTILDLALWAMLIGSREKDKRLLLLSGSLGIQFTSEAIGEAIRAISSGAGGVMAGNVLMLAANLSVLYIWWRTFRPQPAKAAAAK